MEACREKLQQRKNSLTLSSGAHSNTEQSEKEEELVKEGAERPVK